MSYGADGKAVSLVSVAQRGLWLSDRHVRAFVGKKKGSLSFSNLFFIYTFSILESFLKGIIRESY